MAVLMVGIVALLAVVVVATGSLGVAYAARTQATTAADAGALAAAVATYPPTGRRDPVDEARTVVTRNGAKLLSCECRVISHLAIRTDSVVTAVVIDVPVFGHLEIRGVSRAEFDPRRWLGR